MSTKPTREGRARSYQREHPRVSLPSDVEIRADESTCLGRIANVSLGGVLVLTRDTFAPKTKVIVAFKLPVGHGLECAGEVVHTRPNLHMAIRFAELKPEDTLALSVFVDQAKGYIRRSGRLSRRLGVLLQWTELDGQLREDHAETLTLSRHGGLLICGSRMKLGQEFYLWWLAAERGARARVVFRLLGTSSDLVEIGFEFIGAGDFWEMEFPDDMDAVKKPRT